MKREVIFRGKLSHSGEWVLGSLLKIDSNYHIVTESDMYEDGHHICQESDRPTWVDPHTVGEYTGLRDKNGKDIYEGDIVKHNFSNNVFGVVKWHPLGYFYIDVHWDMCEKDDGYLPLGEVMHRTVNGKKIEIEVIGDTYDNPELLNKE